ncbi:hypothetical protein [Streptomyces sp. NPDC054842]
MYRPQVTLSDRFATRDELVDAVFAHRMDGSAAAVGTMARPTRPGTDRAGGCR